MSEKEDFDEGYDRGSAEAVAELRRTVESIIDAQIEKRERQIEILSSEVKSFELLKHEIENKL